jgi:hypothetical protein
VTENINSIVKTSAREIGLLFPELYKWLITLNGLRKMKMFTLYFKTQDPNSKLQVPKEKQEELRV